MELKRKPSLWQKIKYKASGLLYRFKGKRYFLPNVGRPLGAPTFDPIQGAMVVTEQPHPDYYSAMVRQQGEVIAPGPDDIPEDIARSASQAACDHEFKRVIIYPIQGDKRRQVLELLEDILKYPMYEYREANIVNNDDLNSQTIIYKYSGKSHECKPI